MKRDLHQILVQPLLTEKITALREQGNTVGFLVHPSANKIQIKQAVESLLKVKVARVNVMNVRGKMKRFGTICRQARRLEKGICYAERRGKARIVRKRVRPTRAFPSQ